MKDDKKDDKKEDAVVTESDKIWNEIKGLELGIYSLPDQLVEHHVKRLKVTDDAVHLVLKSTAVLPLLEEVLSKVKLPGNKMYQVEQAKYVIVRKVDKE